MVATWVFSLAQMVPLSHKMCIIFSNLIVGFKEFDQHPRSTLSPAQRLESSGPNDLDERRKRIKKRTKYSIQIKIKRRCFFFNLLSIFDFFYVKVTI